MSKSNNVEIDKRINKVFDLLISGATRAQIIQYVSEKTEWGVTERQIDNYIAQANERILEIGKSSREYEFSRSLARLNQLYFYGLTLQNHSVCLGIVKEINRMQGIGISTIKADITTNQTAQVDATTIAAEILRLQAGAESETRSNTNEQ